MTRDEAARILGCDVGSSVDDVRKRFAEKVKGAHPDSGMQPSGGARAAGFAIREFKQARDVLLAAHGEVRAALCPVCRGSGWVQVGFKQERCLRGC